MELISAKLAPLPPSKALISFEPSVAPLPKRYTYWVDMINILNGSQSGEGDFHHAEQQIYCKIRYWHQRYSLYLGTLYLAVRLNRARIHLPYVKFGNC